MYVKVIAMSVYLHVQEREGGGHYVLCDSK